MGIYAKVSNAQGNGHLWCPGHLPRWERKAKGGGCGLWSGPAVNRGWHLLSQAQEGQLEGQFSPQHTAAEGRLGGEPEVISSDSLYCRSPKGAPLEVRASPCGTGLPASLHTTQHSLGFVLRQERDTCDGDKGPGHSHLARGSASRGQQCPFLRPCPHCSHPSLENGGLERGAEAHHQVWHMPCGEDEECELLSSPR